MDKLMKGYVFRLYPTKEQQIQIEKSFGCSRYIYNYFLDKSNGYINAYESIKELPNLSNDKKWLKEVDSCSLRCSNINLRDLNASYNILDEGLRMYMNELQSI